MSSATEQILEQRNESRTRGDALEANIRQALAREAELVAHVRQLEQKLKAALDTLELQEKSTTSRDSFWSRDYHALANRYTKLEGDLVVAVERSGMLYEANRRAELVVQEAEAEIAALRADKEADKRGILKLRGELGARDDEPFMDFVRRLAQERNEACASSTKDREAMTLSDDSLTLEFLYKGLGQVEDDDGKLCVIVDQKRLIATVVAKEAALTRAARAELERNEARSEAVGWRCEAARLEADLLRRDARVESLQQAVQHLFDVAPRPRQGGAFGQVLDTLSIIMKSMEEQHSRRKGDDE